MLHDPFWALHAAGPAGRWPAHLAAGATPPASGRRVPPRLSLTTPTPPPVHQRWRPLVAADARPAAEA
jgi:anthraniloyl-CoA monooxygenase